MDHHNKKTYMSKNYIKLWIIRWIDEIILKNSESEFKSNVDLRIRCKNIYRLSNKRDYHKVIFEVSLSGTNMCNIQKTGQTESLDQSIHNFNRNFLALVLNIFNSAASRISLGYRFLLSHILWFYFLRHLFYHTSFLKLTYPKSYWKSVNLWIKTLAYLQIFVSFRKLQWTTKIGSST